MQRKGSSITSCDCDMAAILMCVICYDAQSLHCKQLQRLHFECPSTTTSLLPRWLTAYRMLPSTCGDTMLPATLHTAQERDFSSEQAVSAQSCGTNRVIVMPAKCW